MENPRRNRITYLIPRKPRQFCSEMQELLVRYKLYMNYQ